MFVDFPKYWPIPYLKFTKKRLLHGPNFEFVLKEFATAFFFFSFSTNILEIRKI